MILICCVDDTGGMAFNNRRQSRDRALLSDMNSLCREKTLWMNAYSAKLFDETWENVAVDEAFLEKAGGGEFCFVENIPLSKIPGNTEELILYKWNRRYPADCCLEADMSGWQMCECTEFQGYSHEKITRERYRQHETTEK